MEKDQCGEPVKVINETSKMQLKRTIGYLEGVSFVVGTIVGAGIFVSPTGVLKYSVLNVGIALIIWTACGIISLMGALCYAELGTALPFSGGEYSHIKRALGSPLAFIFLWVAMFNKPASNATRALLFAEYAIQPFYGECPAPELLKKCLALAVVWFLGIINGRSVKMAAWVQTVFTILKMLALSIIAIGGIVLLIRGRKENLARFENAFNAEIPDVAQLAEAFFQGLYAYGGWWSLNYLAEEVKNPNRNIPWVVMTAVPAVTIFYLLVNISYLTVLTPKEMVSSDLITLTNYLSFSIWLMTGLTCTSLIVLRYREPDLHRPYKVFLPVAFGMVAVSLFLVLAPVVWSPKMQYVYAFLFMVGGLLLYLPFVHFKIHFGLFDKITCYLQLLLEVSPADNKSN
ncbi:solute carrier family 7 member 13 isoform X4 [Anolis carolinensis]|uniref:solute carrier family 7 member 13 isoform X4 n=1 Tax=Anolis carolinensis TaxID=28377 RepID=UPI0004628F1B|nr:PREDICTED: solute carrier family 7 member 13 isoform X4 [Anolis carolinensis]|eukprot:XP_008106648.1 PREDICTED: solute carrier family 7 member 13 isoform X4 [Anolis carolinensis]